MTDPFEILRAQLVQAAARVAAEPVTGSRPGSRWWRRRRPQPLAVVVAGLVICGSATAAVLSLRASASKPLSGQVPGQPLRGPGPAALFSQAGAGYQITVSPGLAAGGAGWTSSLTFSRNGKLAFGERSGGPYPTAASPIFGGTGIGYVQIAPHRTFSLAFSLTGPQVAAIRYDGRTVRTFTSPQLPTGDRAAVFFLPPGAPARSLLEARNASAAELSSSPPDHPSRLGVSRRLSSSRSTPPVRSSRPRHRSQRSRHQPPSGRRRPRTRRLAIAAYDGRPNRPAAPANSISRGCRVLHPNGTHTRPHRARDRSARRASLAAHRHRLRPQRLAHHRRRIAQRTASGRAARRAPGGDAGPWRCWRARSPVAGLKRPLRRQRLAGRLRWVRNRPAPARPRGTAHQSATAHP